MTVDANTDLISSAVLLGVRRLTEIEDRLRRLELERLAGEVHLVAAELATATSGLALT